MKKLPILLLVALVINYSTARSQGLLGEDYFTFSYRNGSAGDIDAWGLGGAYNRSIGQDQNYGYDLAIALAYAKLDDSSVDGDGKEATAGIVLYPIKAVEFKPFLSAHAGFGEANVLGLSGDSFLYQLRLGGEWRASERLTLTPYLYYFEYTELDNGDDLTIGIDANYWFDSSNGVSFGFEQTSRSGIDLNVFTLSYRRSY